jgi:cyanophycinase
MNLRTILLFFIVSTFCIHAQEKKPVTTGPEKGTLVIVGGGRPVEAIMKTFVDLAGGSEARIVVIPTAGGRASYDQNAGGAGRFRELGAHTVEVLHTTDPVIADRVEFVKPIQEATGIWFSGGRQWRLVDAYKNTRTEAELWNVLNRDGVIGGSSAGATIQGSYLARGDTKNNQIMMGDHEEGFGFVKNIAIDQHVLARNRQFDLFDILKNRPELLGIGIDEGTAAVVKQDTLTVIGNSYVLIYDGDFWSREGKELKTLPSAETSFYFLRSGDRYHLREREVIRQDR